jgi:hypothetical protein
MASVASEMNSQRLAQGERHSKHQSNISRSANGVYMEGKRPNWLPFKSPLEEAGWLYNTLMSLINAGCSLTARTDRRIKG